MKSKLIFSILLGSLFLYGCGGESKTEIIPPEEPPVIEPEPEPEPEPPIEPEPEPVPPEPTPPEPEPPIEPEPEPEPTPPKPEPEPELTEQEQWLKLVNEFRSVEQSCSGLLQYLTSHLPSSHIYLEITESGKSLLQHIVQQQAIPPRPPLEWDERLERAAIIHSEDMASNNFISHTGSDGSSFDMRAAREGFFMRTGGENIAAGRSSFEGTLQQWKNSPGHCRNMMGIFESIGVGKAINMNTTWGFYWTMKLGTD